ncbi:hypothetical protein Q5O14_09760 [Eubacteriaceae bacterium ES2]|nr:hypothetical protein Q5O14_09760 [Eubacteriaceae bacterium ES2]
MNWKLIKQTIPYGVGVQVQEWLPGQVHMAQKVLAYGTCLIQLRLLCNKQL